MLDLSVRINKRALFADLGYFPHHLQGKVHDSCADRRVLACGVRWGKSTCAGAEALAAALAPSERPNVGWVVAPNYDLAEKVFREVWRFAHQPELRYRIITARESDKTLVLRNMAGGTSEIRAKSADNEVSLLGEGLDWVVIDEAARLKPRIWQEHLSQRLIDKKGWALAISTPHGKGWFYELHRLAQRTAGWEAWNAPSWGNPYLDQALIESQRAILPERVFRQEYGAEFIEGAGAVFRRVRELATMPCSGDGPTVAEEPRAGEEYYAGLDLAKTEDYTVLVICDSDRRVVYADRFHRVDWTPQIARIRTAVARYNDALVHVDSTGVGEPIYERLCEADMRVEPYKFTAASKAALVNNLAVMLERGDVALLDWDVMIDELESFEYSVTDAGNVRTGSPPGAHDDVAVATMLAMWPLRTTEEAEVQFF